MDTTNNYMTTFLGSIDLSSVDPEKKDIFYSKLKRIIELRFPDIINLNETTDILYIHGTIDNTTGTMEKFVYAISIKILCADDMIIVAQGEDIKDRWDLLIKPDGVYIQEYDFVKTELKKYEP